MILKYLFTIAGVNSFINPMTGILSGTEDIMEMGLYCQEEHTLILSAM